MAYTLVAQRRDGSRWMLLVCNIPCWLEQKPHMDLTCKQGSLTRPESNRSGHEMTVSRRY